MLGFLSVAEGADPSAVHSIRSSLMASSPEYRLYIDEVGNSDLKSSSDPNHRYLSLTGVAFRLTDMRSITSDLDALKSNFFNPDPDEPLILHRKELSRQKWPFHALQDPVLREKFDSELLGLLSEWDYKVITVVIDKLVHLNRYKRWADHPYHYCMMVLLERYTRWLKKFGKQGDVLAECRSKRQDKELKASFQALHSTGTNFVGKDVFQSCLTSKELKLKPKAKNIAGLQIADLIAHPSFRAMKFDREGAQLPDDFGAKIFQILTASKYYRKPNGKIEGCGQKWLP